MFRKVQKQKFQSTLPYGSDLNAKSTLGFDNYISIHAPLRERQFQAIRLLLIRLFQSTLPYGSDDWKNRQDIRDVISIHAPLRERPFLVSTVIPFIQISIHAPLRERLGIYLRSRRHEKFQSTLPYGSDIMISCMMLSIMTFQSTLPYGSDGSYSILKR